MASRKLPFVDRHGGEKAIFVAVGGRILLMRFPDILIFMRMADGVATCMDYTGLDPFPKKEVYLARNLRDRKMQRALMQFFKPENYFLVREAQIQTGRQDLIGGGCDCLIAANPPREAIEARRRQADETARGEYVHKVPNPGQGNRKGYRPGRKRGGRQEKRKDGGAALGP